MEKHHSYTFVKSHRICKAWRWTTPGTNEGQRRLSDCNNAPPRCRVSGWGRLCTQAGGILTLSGLSTQFCCESTTALKYGLSLKKKKYMEGNHKKHPLEPFFQKWFASSWLKEKYMSPKNFQNSIFLMPKSWNDWLSSRLRNGRENPLFGMQWHGRCFPARWFRTPLRETKFLYIKDSSPTLNGSFFTC